MDSSKSSDRMTRPIHPIPTFIAEALAERRLTEAYRARPGYQQNDYIGWITRAKRPETVVKRLAQMLNELEAGGVYIKMTWRAGAK